jgi:hypothetical protein
MKKTILFFGAFLILLSSCTEPNNNNNCGTIKFSWKANGTYFEGSSNYHFLPGVSGLHSYGFTACTGSGSAPSLSLRLHDPIQVGTYNLMDVNDANSAFQGDGSYLDGTGSGYFGTDSAHTGTVVITTMATDSAITGTFSYNTLHSTSTSTINITEGVFTAIPY